MVSPLICGRCGREIRPGDSVTFEGLAPSEQGGRRIVPVNDPDRVKVNHATCPLDEEAADA
jgi:hypothetical protein